MPEINVDRLRYDGINGWRRLRPRPGRLYRRFRFGRKHGGPCGARSFPRRRIHSDVGRLGLSAVPRSVVDDQHRCNRHAGHDQRDHAGMTKCRRDGTRETISRHQKRPQLSYCRLIQLRAPGSAPASVRSRRRREQPVMLYRFTRPARWHCSGSAGPRSADRTDCRSARPLCVPSGHVRPRRD